MSFVSTKPIITEEYMRGILKVSISSCRPDIVSLCVEMRSEIIGLWSCHITWGVTRSCDVL